MPQPNFRVVDAEQPHARDIARGAVKQFRLDRERSDFGKKPGICNQHTDKEARRLCVDDILAGTEREMPEEIRTPYRVNPIVVFWIIVGVLLSAVLVVKNFI